MSKRLASIFFAVVIAVAFVGYFVGIMDGVPQAAGLQEAPLGDAYPRGTETQDSKLIPATNYANISRAGKGSTDHLQAAVQHLPQVNYDLFAPVQPDPAAKAASAKVRASRRAYNGAPPVIPHQVENTTDAACYACHSAGMQLEGRQASVMSHEFLTNCRQCHAPPPPKPFQDAEVSVASDFVGLPAPGAGARAFPGAPPTIPHSRWMRERCNACHGGPHGWSGMETTHPWRTNCTQCHAPSAELDQAIVAQGPAMLAPLDVVAQ